MTSVKQIDVHRQRYDTFTTDEDRTNIWTPFRMFLYFHADVYPYGTLFIKSGLEEGFHVFNSLYNL